MDRHIPDLLMSARPGAWAAGENSLLRLENGLEIRLFTPDDVMAMTGKDQAGRLILRLSDGTAYQLVEDILDPQIVNKGDGSFHPVSADWVIEALAKVDVAGEDVDMHVEIYVLPLPRSGILASSACGEKIFLSPGVRESIAVSSLSRPRTSSATFSSAISLRGNRGTWGDYLKLRGLEDDAVYSADAPRANRPVEIFAEDFRYLFGGSEARYSGGSESGSPSARRGGQSRRVLRGARRSRTVRVQCPARRGAVHALELSEPVQSVDDDSGRFQRPRSGGRRRNRRIGLPRRRLAREAHPGGDDLGG